MSSLPIDDNLRKAIEANAQRRGLSVADYLCLVTDSDELANEQEQDELHRRLQARIDVAEQIEPDSRQTLRLTGRSAEFAAAVVRKHRPAAG